ncbi:hypothetical protein BC826DRAFT_970734 [Russula brevipes]|nr:hypothetical protein BC826DRAFT_970734 [Russula brevipes]
MFPRFLRPIQLSSRRSYSLFSKPPGGRFFNSSKPPKVVPPTTAKSTARVEASATTNGDAPHQTSSSAPPDDPSASPSSTPPTPSSPQSLPTLSSAPTALATHPPLTREYTIRYLANARPWPRTVSSTRCLSLGLPAPATLDDPPETTPEADADTARLLARTLAMNAVSSAVSWDATLRRLGLDSAESTEVGGLAVELDSTRRKRRKKMKKHKLRKRRRLQRAQRLKMARHGNEAETGKAGDTVIHRRGRRHNGNAHEGDQLSERKRGRRERGVHRMRELRGRRKQIEIRTTPWLRVADKTFPKDVVPHLEVNLGTSNWEWEECLAFPVSKLSNLQFSSKPYKWIRYAIGVVVGARGDLCTERDLPNPIPIDYNSVLSSTSIDLYYHTTDQEKRRMFPIGLRLNNTSTVTSSTVSTRRERFCQDVEERDGACVVTGGPASICQAAHILPHSIGDTYIETLSTHRRRESSSSNAVVQGIDDIRNGLFVSAQIHQVLGKHIAFLKTPNFAMDTTDVDSSAERAQERLTNHIFDRSLESYAGRSGSAVRVPSDMSIWPPATLFDVTYASAVVHHFGTKRMDGWKVWEDTFYPGGAIKAGRAYDKHRRDQVDADKDKENAAEQRLARQQRYDTATTGVAGGILSTPTKFSTYIASRPWDPRKRGSI